MVTAALTPKFVLYPSIDVQDPADHGDLVLFAEFSGYTQLPDSLFLPGSPSPSSGSSSARGGGSVSPFNRSAPLPSIGKTVAQVTNMAKEVSVIIALRIRYFIFCV